LGTRGLTVYCIDTCILIDLHQQYPSDIFGVLESIEDMIAKGLAIAPRQVREELKLCDDEVYRWAVRHRGMFKALTSGQAQCAKDILAEFPELAHMDRRVEAADPFVIALALAAKREELHGGDYVVVTSERPRPGRRNIPAACAHFRVRCLGLLDFMRAEGWKFVRGRGSGRPCPHAGV
jgi:hypothetical protein